MTDKGEIVVINDNDFGIVTVTTDANGVDTDITDYVYNAETKTFSKDGVAEQVSVSIGENTEPAQIWIFREKTQEPAVYISVRQAALMAAEAGNPVSIAFDSASDTVHLTSGETYAATGTQVEQQPLASVGSVSAWRLILDGNEVDIPVYHVNGYTYVEQAELEAATGWKLA